MIYRVAQQPQSGSKSADVPTIQIKTPEKEKQGFNLQLHPINFQETPKRRDIGYPEERKDRSSNNSFQNLANFFSTKENRSVTKYTR